MEIKSSWECHRCQKVNAPHVYQCPCQLATASQPFVLPYTPGPFTTGTITVPAQPRGCAFDGLPPGAYGLYCGCPKCSPQYSMIAGWTFTVADGTHTFRC